MKKSSSVATMAEHYCCKLRLYAVFHLTIRVRGEQKHTSLEMFAPGYGQIENQIPRTQYNIVLKYLPSAISSLKLFDAQNFPNHSQILSVCLQQSSKLMRSCHKKM